MLLADLRRPLLNSRALDLDGRPADPASEVMVVPGVVPAASVEGFSIGAHDGIDLSGIGESLEGSIDGGQPDR